MKRFRCFFLALLAGVISIQPAVGQTTIHATRRWAYSTAVGWLNWRANATNGVVVGQYVCSGYLYSPTTGWINTGHGAPTNGVRYTNVSAVDYGVNHDGQGNLSGYAWCETYGWLNFEWTNSSHADAPKIDLATGIFKGCAWGSSLGWVTLSNLSTWAQTTNLYAGADANANGLPDAWEIEELGGTNVVQGGTNDNDGDLVSDYDEYIAGTCPTNINSLFCVTSLESGESGFSLTWPSREIRQYEIDRRASLMTGEWVNAGYLLQGDAGATTITLPVDLNTQHFYRVRALLPLSN